MPKWCGSFSFPVQTFLWDIKEFGYDGIYLCPAQHLAVKYYLYHGKYLRLHQGIVILFHQFASFAFPVISYLGHTVSGMLSVRIKCPYLVYIFVWILDRLYIHMQDFNV